MSASTSPPLEIPLGNAINYRLAYYNASFLSLYFRPIDGLTTATCDYRVVSQYEPTTATFTYWDAYQGNAVQVTPTTAAIDLTIYNNTQEMHKTWLRVRDPVNTNIWSTYEINLFSSQSGARIIVWVFTIDEGGSYT